MSAAGRDDRAAPAAAPPPDAQTLGAWTLAALALVVASGVPMAFVYDTDPARAHAAVTSLTVGVWGVLRGAHAWGASAALALVLVHAARVYLSARISVIGPSRAIAGLAAMAVLIAAYFTGTILAWDQQGWEAYQHLQSAGAAVGVGAVSNDPDNAPLGRVFWLHVLAVPVALLGALAWHLIGRGSVAAAWRRTRRLIHARRRSLSLVVAVVVATGLAWPPELGPAPLARLSVATPDWPFLWLVPLQDAWGAGALLILPLILVAAASLILVGVPHGPRSRGWVVAGVAALVIALTLAGWW